MQNPFRALLTCFAILCSTLVSRGEIVTVHLSSGESSTNTFTANQILQIPFVKGAAAAEVELEGQGTLNLGDLTSAFAKDVVLAGPGRLVVRASGEYIMTVRISPREDDFRPSTAVVIPADATGPVKIILESSTDLLTWTAASPGSYSAGTAKRFFRVRAEKE